MEQETKKCQQCDKEFIPKHIHSKYCSSDCQKKSRRKQDRIGAREKRRKERERLGIKKRKTKKYSKLKKALIVKETVKLVSKGLDIARIAQKIKVPPRTLYRIIGSTNAWQEYKKKKKQVLDAEFAYLAQKSLKYAHKKLSKAGYKDLVISAAIAHDKIYPMPTQLTKIEAEDVTYSIVYPRWKKKE